MPPTELFFPSPSTPDLGCFVERRHELRIEEGAGNIHVDLNPSVDFHPNHHQVYFRVSCGEAAFFQRCLVYMRADLSIPPPLLSSLPPDFVLGGDFRPHPSDWQKFPTQGGQRFYFFIGQHRDPAGDSWRADALTGHAYDLYENGTLSTVHFDDTGTDRDLDDFILEVAVVGRSRWDELAQAVDQAEVSERVEEDWLPAVRERVWERTA